MVRSVINEVDASVPVMSVRASRGKWLRAEPVATLYEQGRVRHLPGLATLEDELCGWSAATGEASRLLRVDFAQHHLAFDRTPRR